MSVIISGDKLIVHSYMVPVVFDSIQEPGVRYLIADGKWTPIPNHLGYKHITHFKREYKGAKNEAFKTISICGFEFIKSKYSNLVKK